MAEMKPPPIVVIGDVVGSRTAAHRGRLHDRLSAALAETNRRWDADLRITVGDEYQGTLPSLGAATAAVLWLRVALLPEHDLRHGIARGDVRILDSRTGVQDGPGWWAARAAIDEVHDLAGRPATRGARTTYREADDVGGGPAPGLPGALRAALLARDELVGRLDERSLSVLRGLLAGRTQREIAAELGLSGSAVSQRVRRDGIGVVLQTTAWLEDLG
ncbi:SatD family protein [Nocardioides sp. W7]|uniref:SatD family protein n=1 Tax=Nocardioides sp. W7 TaxID=2931390 RepID=UPI001FD4131D|nr:SatD family protein [Nocardioides sp. W7]